ncbi:hypothetical protein N9H35_00990 [bacterium]|nr:hypothetical protein [bacterium]
MATWKKVIVSGSGVSQLSNDANFLASNGDGQSLTNLTFANITNRTEGIQDIVGSMVDGGTETNITVTYDDTTGKLNFVANAGDVTAVTAGTGLTGGGTEGDLTVNVVGGDGITANADELEVTVDDSTIELSATDGTGAVRVKADGIGSSHLAAGAVDTTALGADAVNGDKIADDAVNSEHLAAGAIDTEHIGDDQVTAAKLANTAVTAGSYGSTTQVPQLTIDAQGRVTAASVASIATSFDIAADSGTTDTVAGGETLTFGGGNGVSTTVSDNNIAINIASGIVSASNFSAPSQGTMRSGLNGVNTDVDLGLQTSDSPSFAGLTINGNQVVTGDLTVQGTTTTLSTTNTAIKDKFILLNSGSANPDQGGIIIDEGSGTGHGLIYDEGDGRFGINQSVSSTATSANSEAYVALVVDQDNVAHDITDTEYHKRGNMKVDSSDDIFIYV